MRKIEGYVETWQPCQCKKYKAKLDNNAKNSYRVKRGQRFLLSVTTTTQVRKVSQLLYDLEAGFMIV